MTRVEVKALFARINGKPLKWKAQGVNKGIELDAFVLANMKSGISVKVLDPDECKAKGYKASTYEPSDPRHCLIAARFIHEGEIVGYDNVSIVVQLDVINVAKIIDDVDSETPVSQDDIFGSVLCGTGACPMY